jgi:hypothetical protein
MERRRPIGKWVALGCGALIALLVVVALAAWLIISSGGGRRSQSALARIKASGAPTTWAEAIPKPVPDDQNAAALYEKAFAALAMTLTRVEQDAFYGYFFNTPGADRRQFKALAMRILAANGPALAYLAEAAKRPKCRFNRDWSDPSSMTFRQQARMKDLSRLACAQAVLDFDRGDTKGALEAWSLNLSLVNHLGSDPFLVSQLTRFAILAIAAASLNSTLQNSRPTPEQCRALARELRRINLTLGFVKSLEVTRVESLWWFKRAREDQDIWLGWTGRGPSPTFVTSTPPSANATVRQALQQAGLSFEWVGYRAVSPFDEAEMLDVWERMIALARRPYRETARQYGALDKQIASLPRFAMLTRASGPMWRAVQARDRAEVELALVRPLAERKTVETAVLQDGERSILVKGSHAKERSRIGKIRSQRI